MNFRIFNISIYIDLSFWILLLFIMGTGHNPDYIENLIYTIGFALSIFFQEYGHALAALFFRTDPTIVLQAFEGKTEYDQTVVTAKQKFLINLAGPLFQGILSLLLFILLKFQLVGSTPGTRILFILAKCNIIWFLLQLIPIEPLKGGCLVRYILENQFNYKGYRASILIGIIAAALIIPFSYCYLPDRYLFFTIQLFLSGWRYCKLWQQSKLDKSKNSRIT